MFASQKQNPTPLTMFSRRHPYLFAVLILAGIMSVTMLGSSLLFYFGAAESEFADVLKSGNDKVGVIEIKGIITDTKDVLEALKHFRKAASVKAIVLRIDSPGGVVGPSQEIYREVRKTEAEKNIVVSMGSVAASGGYYIAAGAHGIVANPGTITGSIGVIMEYTNFKAVLDKIGLVPVIVKSGEYKDIGSPMRKMTAKEEEILQEFVNQTHKQFVKAIVEGRNMDQSTVEALADGRIFTGEEAQKLGLVDRLGNLEDAIDWAGELGGIEGEISTVYPPEKKFDFFRYVTESILQAITERLSYSDLSGGYIYRPDAR